MVNIVQFFDYLKTTQKFSLKGIKPSNVESVVKDTLEASSKSGACEFWIDMESGVRTTLIHHDKGCTETKDDVFDLTKCYNVIDIVCGLGLMEHPKELR